MARASWFSDEGDEHVFQAYLERIGMWEHALKEGDVCLEDIRAQARRVADLMYQVERRLNEDQRALVTQLLVELTVLHALQSAFLVQQAQNAHLRPQLPKSQERGARS